MADETPKKKSEMPSEQAKKRKPFFEAVGILIIIVLVIFISLGWIFKQFNAQLNTCMSEKVEYVNQCSAVQEKIGVALKNAQYELSVADERCAVQRASLEETIAEKNAVLERQKLRLEELEWEVNRLKNQLPGLPSEAAE